MPSTWTNRILADSADSDAWLQARRTVITASDVASILGFGGKSRAAVLREKLSSEYVDNGVGDLAMVAAGRNLEDGVFQWFASDTLHETGVRCGSLVRSPTVPYIAATPDALLDDEPVEIKLADWTSRPNWHEYSASPLPLSWPRTVGRPNPIASRTRIAPRNLRVAVVDRNTPRGDYRDAASRVMGLLPTLGPSAAPTKYWVQLQVQMHVLDTPRGWLVGCMAGTERFDFYYARDAAFETWMLGELALFWNDWQRKAA